MAWLKWLGRKNRAFGRLSQAERRVFAQAVLGLPLTALSLKLVGLKQTQRWLRRFEPGSRSAASVPVARVAHLVALAAGCNRPWTNCLNHSLVLWWLLQGQEGNCSLQVGVRREGGKFEAHAWVEWQGHVLNDSGEVRQWFTTFDRPLLEERR